MMRASRLLSMLILLQLRGRITAAQFADEFEVSIRTVYRDVDALSAAGVPVYADRGPGGGFALLDGWRTRLTGMSEAEAEAMPLAGLVDTARDLGLGGPADTAARKLHVALPKVFAAQAERVSRRVHIDPVDWYRAGDDLPQLPLIARAVLDARQMTMRYDSWTQIRDWRVDPLGLVLKGGHWYLVASGAAKVRSFRVSAMSDVVVLDGPAERSPHFDLAHWWRGQVARFEAGLRPMTVRLRVADVARARVRDLGAYAAKALAEGQAVEGATEIELPVESAKQAAQLVLGLAPDVVALDNPLRAAVVALARQASALHDPSVSGKRSFARG